MVQEQNKTRSTSPIVTYLLIAVLTGMAAITGFNYFFKPFSSTPASVATELSVEATPVATSAGTLDYRAFVEKLTPEAKVAQLMALPVTLTNSTQSAATQDDYIDFISDGAEDREETKPIAWGFFTLFGSDIDFARAKEAVTAYKTRFASEIPVWSAVDHEGGTVQRLAGEGFTQLPSWQELCALGTNERQAVLQKSADELAKVGINIVLAPVLDIAANNRILATRICSGDPGVVGVAATEYVATFNSFAMYPTLKHYPGIGATTRDLHSAFDTVTVTNESIDAYRFILSVYPKTAVMTTHVGVTNQHPEVPCSLSSDCVGQIHELFPETLIITDALEMKATGINGSSRQLEDVALEALLAGNTVLLFGEGVSEDQLRIVHSRLVQEYDNSYQVREKVNAAVMLILSHKLPTL